MGKYLDIDDAVAANPVAERELAELRGRVERAEAENTRLTRWIKWYLDQLDEEDWTTEDQMLLEAAREGAPPPESEPDLARRGEDAREDAWLVGRGSIPAWASPTEREKDRHKDEAAVNRFSEDMKAKLAKAREKGRGGWEDPEQCPAERLATMLIEHLRKGNEGTFEDVANFAMMLHQRDEAPETLARAWLEADKEATDRGYRYAIKAAAHPAPEQTHRWTERDIRRHLTASVVPEQVDAAFDTFLDREHEITSYPERPPHGNWPDEWDEKPFARIKWAEDRGDPSVGMEGWSGFCLTEDQSGTVLGDLTASGVPDDRVPHKCPTCGSPSPERHPAVQFEGEVIPCRDPWHQHHPGDLGQQTAESVLRSLASWLGMGGYNADRVDPATFEAKIREGVESAIRVEKQRASGVPYVPEEITEDQVLDRDGPPFARLHARFYAFGWNACREQALASAPAVSDTRIGEARRLLEQSAEPFDRACSILREVDSAPTVPSGLSFAQLREANVQRCETAFHALNHWNPMEWGAACAGEVGEGINAAKKLRRVQDSEQYKKTLPTTAVTVQDVADEIADTVIYADLWAASMGIDLGAVVASQFNRTSDKVQSEVKLPIASTPTHGGSEDE